MAAKRYSVDEVAAEVLQNGSDSEDIADESEPEDLEESLKIKIDEFTEAVTDLEPGLQANSDVFKACTVRFLLPCLRICASGHASGHLATVLRINLNCGSILSRESRLWLNLLTRRLGGRQRIKTPYYGEIKRDLPFEIYDALKLAIKRSDLKEFKEPKCYVSGNRKADCISFTCEKSVLLLFATLTGYREGQVKGYFRRALKAGKDGKAKIIVGPEKDFALVYKRSKGQFTVGFHFGVWNSHGFPQHS